jgi:hypothetical protein
MTSDAWDWERAEVLRELCQSFPPHDVLLRWACDNVPPQSWFDEDEDLL